MAFTYTPDFTLPRDQLRFAIGDTDAADPQLQDAEVAHVLSLEGGNVRRASLRAVDGLIAKWARRVSFSSGDYSESDVRARVENLTQLRQNILDQGAVGAVPTAGGISRSEKAALEADPDRPWPYTRLGQHDHPAAASEDRGPTPVRESA